jgi:hypothetical protein
MPLSSGLLALLIDVIDVIDEGQLVRDLLTDDLLDARLELVASHPRRDIHLALVEDVGGALVVRSLFSPFVPSTCQDWPTHVSPSDQPARCRRSRHSSTGG